MYEATAPVVGQKASEPAGVSGAEYFGYGLGDFAFNLIWSSGLAYSVYFYTDICVIPASIVAVIMLVARILNAGTDPLIGLWIDRRVNSERTRPFIKWGAIPLGLALFLSFIPLSGSVAQKAAWASVTYLSVIVLYSLLNIPYGVLLNLMTGDSRTRLNLATARMVGAGTGGMLIGLVTVKATTLLGGDSIRRGFALYGAIAGFTTAALLLLTWKLTTERLVYSTRAGIGLVSSIKSLILDRDWLAITASMGFATIAGTMIYAMAIYFAIYSIRRDELFGGTLISVLSFATLLGTFAAPFAAGLLGSRRSAIVANLGQAALLVPVCVIPLTSSLALLIAAVVGFLAGMREPSVYTLLSNVLDKQAADGGTANIGLGYSLNSALCKAAFGIGSGATGAMLAMSDYVPGAKSQAASAMQAIRLGFGLLPAMLLILAAWMIFFTRVDPDARSPNTNHNRPIAR
jgi:GPH family glycoside/pentoside/hexuronide:cation symporter